MFFHCLSLSLSRLLLAAADLPDVVCCRFFVQFTLLCCTRHTTTDKELRLEAFQSLHCVAARARAHALWVKVQLWWLFLCYFVNVKMFARILFFFTVQMQGFVVLSQSECHVLMQECGDIVLDMTGTHCVIQQNVQNLELRFSSHRLVPLQSVCVSDSWNSGFLLISTTQLLVVHLIVRCGFFPSTKIQWEHRGDATFSPSYRQVQLRMYWECAGW